MSHHTPSFLFQALTLPGETFDFVTTYWNCSSCMLCNVGYVNVASHLEEVKHKERVEALKRYRDTVRDAAERHDRVLDLGDKFNSGLEEQVPFPAWRDAVQASLFRYLMATDDPAHVLLNRPIYALQKYKFLEKLALLELAVWKAKCQSEMPPGLDFIAVQEWVATGWKAHKVEQRKSNTLEIIFKAVMPFLDVPPNV